MHLLRTTLLPFTLSLGLSGFSHAQTTACPQHFAQGQAPDITNPPMTAQTRPLCFEGFAVLHSGISRTPLWAAERLSTASIQQAQSISRKDKFHAEPQLPESERAELTDYVRSGFDRGHMIPAGDMPTLSAQAESFSLANMIPQNPNNNQMLWAGLEAAVRELASQRGELFVITGPLFEGKLQRLNGRVLVPSGVFKAIYDPARREAAAYLAANQPGPNYQVVPIAVLEQRLGITLFPKMPAAIRQKAMALPGPSTQRK